VLLEATRFTRGLIVGLLVVTAVSIILNVIVYRQAWKYYLQLNETRLEPIGLSYYPTAAEGAALKSDIVVFFGDSRAYEWPAPPDMDAFTFMNRGIGGQTSAQVAARFDAHIAPLQPQIVILQVCINDLKTIPLFPQNKTAIIANCIANIEQIVDKSVALDADVILTTIFPLGKLSLKRRPFWSDDVAAAITEVNAFIESLAGPHVMVLDTAVVLADENGIVQQTYSKDFLHLNETGYEALNKELIQMLAQVQADSLIGENK